MKRIIVAINGCIGSGKDTFSEEFIRDGFKRMSFAETLKDAVSVIFCWDREILEGSTEESRILRETPDEYWSKKLGFDVTPRWVLQNFGTQVMRNNFDDNIWVYSLENKMRSIEGNIIITDCRFPNEINMLRENNGKIIEVQRVQPSWYNDACVYNNYVQNRYKELENTPMAHYDMEDFDMEITSSIPASLYDIHESEYAWVGLNNADYVVQNDGSKEDLHYKAKVIIHGLKDSQ